MNDNYNAPQWIKEIFNGWYDPCPISKGELREFDGLAEVMLQKAELLKVKGDLIKDAGSKLTGGDNGRRN